MAADDSRGPQGFMIPESEPLEVSGAQMSEALEASPTHGVEQPLVISRNELEWGLRFTHWMAVRAQENVYDHELTLYALAELLVAKGVISVAEVDQWRARVKQRADRDLQEEPRVRMGANADKYSPAVETVLINCAERVQYCRAACCRLTFPLTRQDLDEGVVRWEYRDPYMIKQREDGWCHHNAPGFGCTIHPQRPLTCRVYSCREDARIWMDFEKMIPHPSLAQLEPRTSEG